MTAKKTSKTLVVQPKSKPKGPFKERKSPRCAPVERRKYECGALGCYYWSQKKSNTARHIEDVHRVGITSMRQTLKDRFGKFILSRELDLHET